MSACAIYNYDDRGGDSSLSQGDVKASRVGVYADRVDDDKYGDHSEIDNNKTEDQLIVNDSATPAEIDSSENTPLIAIIRVKYVTQRTRLDVLLVITKCC